MAQTVVVSMVEEEKDDFINVFSGLKMEEEQFDEKKIYKEDSVIEIQGDEKKNDKVMNEQPTREELAVPTTCAIDIMNKRLDPQLVYGTKPEEYVEQDESGYNGEDENGWCDPFALDGDCEEAPNGSSTKPITVPVLAQHGIHDVPTPPASPEYASETGFYRTENRRLHHVELWGVSPDSSDDELREQCRRNATALRKVHYERKHAKAIEGYMINCFKFCYPIDFLEWRPRTDTGLEFRKREVPGVISWEDATESESYLLSKLSTELIVSIMKLLDYRSAKSLTRCSKQLFDIYKANSTTICRKIIYRTKNLVHIPDFLRARGEASAEAKLQAHHHAVEWIVDEMLSARYKIQKEVNDAFVYNIRFKELQRYEESILGASRDPLRLAPNVSEEKKAKILKGRDYPFRGLLIYLLSKRIGSPRMSRPDQPRLFKHLTFWEKSILSRDEDMRMAERYMADLICWYLRRDRCAWDAIQSQLTDEDDDEMSEADFLDSLVGMSAVQLWELMRLVGMKMDDLLWIMIERGDEESLEKVKASVGSGSMNSKLVAWAMKQEFLEERVKQILGNWEK